MKLLFPYFTSSYRLPDLIPYLWKGMSLFKSKSMFVTVNLWNFNEKRGTDSFNNKSLEYFIKEIEKIEKVLINNNLADLCSESLDENIYFQNLDLTDKLLEGLDEYPL